MRILVFNFEYPPLGGGGGVATRDIVEELKKRHEVHVITTWWQGLPVNEQSGSAYIHRVRVPGRKELPTATVLSMVAYVPVAIWQGWKLARLIKPDVINAQFVLPSGLPAALLAAVIKRPLVVSLIGGDIYDPTKGISPHRHWWLRWMVRCVVNRAKAVTAISSDTMRRAKELHGVKKDIQVIPLGLVDRQWPLMDRAALGLSSQEVLFVSIGRLIPRKRYMDLLEAWQSVPEANLAIIGSGPLQTELEEAIKDMGLRGRVRLMGQVSEERKHQVLAVADGYVSAAEHEGFGIVFLEAMQAGLPIVAANDGGQRDFLQAEENALLVKPRDIHALGQAVMRIAADKELRRRIGAANREKVKEYYIEKTAGKFEHVLVEAVKV